MLLTSQQCQVEEDMVEMMMLRVRMYRWRADEEERLVELLGAVVVVFSERLLDGTHVEWGG
jgi:hypothetical protein